MVKLSFFSSVVPVFTETVFPGITNADPVPNVADLAKLSDRMWEIMKN